MFSVLFEETKKALEREDLLPALGGTYASAADSCLARTEELRELLSPTQLAALHGARGRCAGSTGPSRETGRRDYSGT